MAITANIISEFNDRGVKAAEGAFGKMSKSVIAAGAAMATSIAAVTKGLYEAVQAAAEDQKSFTQLAQAIKNVTGASDALIASTDKQIGKMSMQLGIADDQLRPAFANLVRATGDLTLAQKGLNATADLATAKNIDLESASSAVGKALAGNTTALLKMLPGLKGVIDNGSSAADVLAAINSQVGGSAEANTRTFAGALARLKVIFGEMVETVGSWLLPALTQLADLLNNALGRAFTFLSDTLGPKITDLFTRLGNVFRENIVPVLQDYVIPAFQYLADVYYNRILPALEQVARMFIEKLGKAFTMIRDKIEQNRDSFEGLREFMDKVVVFITRYFIPAYTRFMGDALDRGIKMLGWTIDAFARFVDYARPFVSAISKMVGGAVKGITAIVNAGIDGLNSFIGIYNRLPGAFKPFGDIGLIPRITLPDLDFNTYAPGGMGIWGENRGGMSSGGLTGIPETIIPTPSGGNRGGNRGGSADFGPQAPPSLGQISGFGAIGLGWDLSQIPIAPMPGDININVEGGLATSAEIGRAIVDALKQYTNVSGPAAIAVA